MNTTTTDKTKLVQYIASIDNYDYNLCLRIDPDTLDCEIVSVDRESVYKFTDRLDNLMDARLEYCGTFPAYLTDIGIKDEDDESYEELENKYYEEYREQFNEFALEWAGQYLEDWLQAKSWEEE